MSSSSNGPSVFSVWIRAIFWDTTGLRPLPDKVDAVSCFPQPVTVKALQEYLGMLNYYHRFLPHIAEVLLPLHNALKGRKANQPLGWTPEMVNAFAA